MKDLGEDYVLSCFVFYFLYVSDSEQQIVGVPTPVGVVLLLSSEFRSLLRLFLAVFDYSYRDYVLSWYGNLSRDEGQLYNLLLEDFWEIAKQLHHRLSHVDVVKVVCNDVVRTLLTHFCDLKAANAR